MQDWLRPANLVLSDIYAIGFQEIVDLNPTNVVLDGSKTIERAEYWLEKTRQCLEETGVTFTLLMEQHLVGILLLVFVKEVLAPHVRHIRGAVTATGVLGVMGNKGGVCIRMNLYDSTICFVCAHLAASRNNVSGRNSDTAQILDRSIFPPDELPGSMDESAVPVKKGLIRTYKGIYDTSIRYSELNVMKDHDVVFWIGDLNYRVENSIATDDIFNAVDSDDLEFLRIHDQLNIERLNKRSYIGFQEGKILFPPTYKFIPGTDIYERRPGKKLRPPAWCDRVLWYTNPVNNIDPSSIQLKSYRCAAVLNQSDHKPISARFDCLFRFCIEEKERAFYQELLRNIDKWENSCIPKVEIVNRDIDFGHISVNTVVVNSIHIRNIGNRIAKWEFVCPYPDAASISKPLYSIYPVVGVLAPGEVSMV